MKILTVFFLLLSLLVNCQVSLVTEATDPINHHIPTISIGMDIKIKKIAVEYTVGFRTPSYNYEISKFNQTYRKSRFAFKFYHNNNKGREVFKGFMFSNRINSFEVPNLYIHHRYTDYQITNAKLVSKVFKFHFFHGKRWDIGGKMFLEGLVGIGFSVREITYSAETKTAYYSQSGSFLTGLVPSDNYMEVQNFISPLLQLRIGYKLKSLQK